MSPILSIWGAAKLSRSQSVRHVDYRYATGVQPTITHMLWSLPSSRIRRPGIAMVLYDLSISDHYRIYSRTTTVIEVQAGAHDQGLGGSRILLGGG